jgi:hypothetical protein
LLDRLSAELHAERIAHAERQRFALNARADASAARWSVGDGLSRRLQAAAARVARSVFRQFGSVLIESPRVDLLQYPCYPEGSAGVPYQPFVEAFEGFARQRDTEALRA